MLKNKAKPITVQSDQLYKISLSILDSYDIQPNLPFLLLLSFLTVKEYSRAHDHLDKNAKTDLCLQYMPDLIHGLNQSNIIEQALADEVKQQLMEHQQDIKSHLEVYHVIFGYKNDHALVKTKKCCMR